MKSLNSTVPTSDPTRLVWVTKEVTTLNMAAAPAAFPLSGIIPLKPLRQWLDNFHIQDAKTARWICEKIPARCPFERTITILGHTLLRIPPLCKLNPLYEELVSLRFRALCYLADECGEDVSRYC